MRRIKIKRDEVLDDRVYTVETRIKVSIFCFILLTHEGSHRAVYQEFQPSYDIFHRGCQVLFKPQVPCTTLANTAQWLTLHQHRTNNQSRTANQI